MSLNPPFSAKNILKQILPKELKSVLRKALDECWIQVWKIKWWIQRDFSPIKPPDKEGVLLIGYPHGEFGLGTHLRVTAEALKKARVPFKVFDFNTHLQARQQDRTLEQEHSFFPEFKINLFCVGADQIPMLKKTLGNSFFKNHYNILYTHWELSKLPEPWIPYLESMDEIWASTRFIQDAFKKSTQKPVEWMPLAISSKSHFSPTHSSDKKTEKNFIFLFAFDFDSYIHRKNPRAIIRAFQMAFPNAASNQVSLIIKSISGERHLAQCVELQEEAAQDSRIQFLNKMISYEENMELMESCDCYISLHRSEGFGLTLAEAMLRGKPVITTGYSGNMDFTTPKTACLVDYELVSVAEGEYLFPESQVWAEANVEHAASCMKKMVNDPVFRKELAQSGQNFILEHYSPECIGDLYQNRIHELLKNKQ